MCIRDRVRTFNCGVGMVLVVSEKDAEQTLQALKENNTDAWQLGHIESSSGAATVRFE